MIFFKNAGKSLLISYGFITALTLIITILNYFSILNLNILNYLFYVIPFISFVIGGYTLGKKSLNKGWLVGLKFGFLSILSLIIVNLILFQEFILANIFNFIIILISSIIGSILGINKKTE